MTTPQIKTKRRIYQNIYGNWRGYVGRKQVIEFGADEVYAGHWLLTGSDCALDGYESNESISAAKDAARKS